MSVRGGRLSFDTAQDNTVSNEEANAPVRPTQGRGRAYYVNSLDTSTRVTSALAANLG